MARNRAALDAYGFRPRVLRDVSNVDSSRTFFGKKLRIPVLCSAVGSVENFEPGGGAAVAKATREFGNGMILSSGAHPGLEKPQKLLATASRSTSSMCAATLIGSTTMFAARSITAMTHRGFTIDTDSYSRRERGHRQTLTNGGASRVEEARIFPGKVQLARHRADQEEL